VKADALWAPEWLPALTGKKVQGQKFKVRSQKIKMTFDFGLLTVPCGFPVLNFLDTVWEL